MPAADAPKELGGGVGQAKRRWDLAVLIRGALVALACGLWGGGKVLGAQTASSAPKQQAAVAKDGKSSAGAAAGAGMEFSDDPNFAVAGVTDWTAVGGHGSDAVLRTSEDLTRETVRMKTQDGGGERPRAAAEGTEGRLRAGLAVSPRSYAANQELGVYLLHAGRFAEAVPLLKKAVELGGEQAGDEYDLALACQGVEDPAQAQVHLQQAMAQKDEARYHRLSGELAEGRGDSLAAVRELQRATQMEPNEANTFAWGSELLLHRAIWQAAEVFAHGAQEYPASARMKTAWGAALFAGARYEDAARQLCLASDQAPADAEPYLFLGKMALVAGSPLPCVQEKLGRFVALPPESAEANYFYGMALIKNGDAAEAARGRGLLERAVTLDPKYAAAHLELGILAFGRKDYPEAIREYEKAVAADTQLAEAHYRLGVAYDRMGDAARARQEFARHDALDQAQARAVDEQRRQVKQFLVVVEGKPGTAAQP